MVEELLNVGKENAISSKTLVILTGCKSKRELQRIIAEERDAGAVILSTSKDGGGYYLPADAQEAREFVHTLESRGKNTFRALKSTREYLKKMENQDSSELPGGDEDGE